MESRTFGFGSKRRSRSIASIASFPSTSPEWMFAWMYATGRPSRRASAGDVISGRDAMTKGRSRPSVVFPIDPVSIFAPSTLSESMNLITSS
jgi:hypothetical protein